MGLGKTIELLALISLHTLSNSPYIHVDNELIITKTTIVITPKIITRQWISEIKKHAPHLKYHVYEGAQYTALCDETIRHIDILLIDYSILSTELGYTTSNSRPRRSEREYELKTSILTKYKWFRGIQYDY